MVARAPFRATSEARRRLVEACSGSSSPLLQVAERAPPVGFLPPKSMLCRARALKNCAKILREKARKVTLDRLPLEPTGLVSFPKFAQSPFSQNGPGARAITLDETGGLPRQSSCRQSSGELYRLSRILGHTTLQMGSRYSHLRSDDLHDETDRVAQSGHASAGLGGHTLTRRRAESFPEGPENRWNSTTFLDMTRRIFDGTATPARTGDL